MFLQVASWDNKCRSDNLRISDLIAWFDLVIKYNNMILTQFLGRLLQIKAQIGLIGNRTFFSCELETQMAYLLLLQDMLFLLARWHSHKNRRLTGQIFGCP